MRKRLWFALILFLLLTVSSLSYAGYIAYRTYQIDSDDGKTILTGIVKRSDGDPIGNVEVTLGDMIIFTDVNGRFTLDGIDSGMVEIEFYKAGYVPLELNYLAYPYDEVKDDLEDSPNNISSEQDLVLLYEMEVLYPFQKIENGTVEIKFESTADGILSGRHLLYSNGTLPFSNVSIGTGIQTISIDGNGTILFGLVDGERIITWKQVPGRTVDITSELMALASGSESINDSVGRLSIVLDDKGFEGEVELTIIDPLFGEDARSIILDGSGEHLIDLDVNPGSVIVRITGRGVRDREYRDIPTNDTITKELSIEVVKANPDTLLEGLDLTANYYLAAGYGVFSLIFILGAYLVKKGKRWAIPFIIALLGFVTNGFPWVPFHVNMLIASFVIIMIFISREDFAAREKEHIKIS